MWSTGSSWTFVNLQKNLRRVSLKTPDATGLFPVLLSSPQNYLKGTLEKELRDRTQLLG